MEVRVADPNAMCTTLLLVNVYHPLSSFEAFAKSVKLAVKEFDNRESEWHYEVTEDWPNYDYEVKQHGLVLVTTNGEAGSSILTSYLDRLGFKPVIEGRATKTSNTITLHAVDVKTFLENLDKN